MTSNLQVVQEVALIRKYHSMGVTPVNISIRLEQEHKIVLSVKRVKDIIREIAEGKYPDDWLDNLLDIHYPKIYEQTMEALSEDLQHLKLLRDTEEDPELKARFTRLHGRMALEVLTVLHKGPVIREAKKLSSNYKYLVRQVMTDANTIKKLGPKEQMENNRDLYPVIVTFDENMQRVEEDLKTTAEEDKTLSEKAEKI